MLLAVGLTDARAAKPTRAASTTWLDLSAHPIGGCYNADPTTDCGHAGVGTADGTMGGKSTWTAWATLPEVGATPITESGNAYSGGYAYTYYKVPRGTKALDLIARLNVTNKLRATMQGAGYGIGDIFLEYFPAGCSEQACAHKERLRALDATNIEAPSEVSARHFTIDLRVSAYPGTTLQEGQSRLQVTYVNFAGSRQTPGNAGLAEGTMRLTDLTITPS